MKTAKKIARRIKSRAGESISEVLFALLIAAVALVMLVSMIAASTKLIDNSRKAVEEYYAANNKLAGGNEAPAGSGRALLKDGAETVAEFSVDVYANDELASGTVISYKNK